MGAGGAGFVGAVLLAHRVGTVKRHGKTLRRRRCTVKDVRGTPTFTTTVASATLTRGRVVYASGTARLTRLVLHPRRAVAPGRYTLTLTHGRGDRRYTTRQSVTLD
ncbi:MAG TPA: hypothetical protein VIX82_08645 [Solirubrobacteraceae bacterium]